MFKHVKAKTFKEYVDELPQERRQIIIALDSLIRSTAPSLEPNFLYNMPGYGTFPYKNYKNKESEWPIIAVASQKNYISIYICAVLDGQYIAEKYKDTLGKVSVGKSCIRFKAIEDLNIDVLKTVIQEAVRSPGLISGKSKNI